MEVEGENISTITLLLRFAEGRAPTGNLVGLLKVNEAYTEQILLNSFAWENMGIKTHDGYKTQNRGHRR